MTNSVYLFFFNEGVAYYSLDKDDLINFLKVKSDSYSNTIIEFQVEASLFEMLKRKPNNFHIDESNRKRLEDRFIAYAKENTKENFLHMAIAFTEDNVIISTSLNSLMQAYEKDNKIFLAVPRWIDIPFEVKVTLSASFEQTCYYY